ncbi:hypothetical protein SAMN05519104_2620 [Rhizobiales bacterium GAS188]|nr:hypothetical protein SAMN05519104_2620 [Rhizobiales bacterium GAS188]
MQIDFDWDPAKAKRNAAKHRATFEEAMTVFRDPHALSMLDTDHSIGEERWITLGATTSGNLLLVVHSWRETAAGRVGVRIISARRPTKSEARQYREGS